MQRAAQDGMRSLNTLSSQDQGDSLQSLPQSMCLPWKETALQLRPTSPPSFPALLHGMSSPSSLDPIPCTPPAPPGAASVSLLPGLLRLLASHTVLTVAAEGSSLRTHLSPFAELHDFVVAVCPSWTSPLTPSPHLCWANFPPSRAAQIRPPPRSPL